jgi:hypothetical protein
LAVAVNRGWISAALATFMCGPSHDLGISQSEKGKHFRVLRNIGINIRTLSKRQVTIAEKYFDEKIWL